MKRLPGSILSGLLCGLFIVFCFNLPAAAQSADNISPKTQQYIDNLNEVREAQNGGQTVNNQQPPAQGTSAWKYVFYGALSGAAYAFWRWLKKIRSGD